MRLPLIALLLAANGCAWAPGTGFGTLQRAVTTAALPIDASRQDEAGRWKTNNGYRLTIAERQVRVYVGAVGLDGAGTGAASGTRTFDPANPPPGYSLCHGGHCHRADGALIDYAEIQATLNNLPAEPVTQRVMTLKPSTSVTFVPLGGETRLDSFFCEPAQPAPCEFPEGQLESATLYMSQIQAYGQAAAAPGIPALGAAPVEWELDFTFPQALAFKGPLSGGTLDRQSPARLQLAGRLKLTERLLDDIEWGRLAAAADGATIKLEADEATRETILKNLARTTFDGEIKAWEAQP